MFFLLGDVFPHHVALRGAHGESSISFLPGKPTVTGFLMHPARGSGFHIAHDIREARRRPQADEKVDMVRSTPGPDYAAEDESTVASIPPGGPLAYTSSAGFGQPGNAVSYKVYIRLTTANEAGSDAVTVTRPL